MKRQPSRPQVIIEALKVFQSLSVGWDVSFFFRDSFLRYSRHFLRVSRARSQLQAWMVFPRTGKVVDGFCSLRKGEVSENVPLGPKILHIGGIDKIWSLCFYWFFL